MGEMRLPLTLSTAGHAIALALLILLVAEPSPPEPPVRGGIEVVLGQSLSQPQAVLAPEAASQPADPSTIAALPPQEIAEPEPVVAATEPPPTPMPETLPPDQTAPTPPPPQKPLVRQPPKTVVHRPQPRAIVSPTPTATPLAEARSAASPSSQYSTMQSAAAAAMPATVPGPDLTANYSAMISAWLEAHKHYPESARERGEEAGGVKLRFRVDRFGRVLDYRLLESTGYADLDAGIDQMMRGAQLPPFPSGMTQSEIEVSVKLRFKLAR
jgi:periplasmic protein TonB